jgi:hypothetical protein
MPWVSALTCVIHPPPLQVNFPLGSLTSLESVDDAEDWTFKTERLTGREQQQEADNHAPAGAEGPGQTPADATATAAAGEGQHGHERGNRGEPVGNSSSSGGGTATK